VNSGILCEPQFPKWDPCCFPRLLGLNETQTGILNIVFRVADEKQMLLIDIKDLRAMLQYVSDNATEFRTVYGNISAASVGAILRSLLTIEDQGGHLFFGEPHWMSWIGCAPTVVAGV
jgi:DNA helicase HerA-like ATPase